MDEESYVQQITAENKKQFAKLKQKKYSENLIYMMAVEKNTLGGICSGYDEEGYFCGKN